MREEEHMTKFKLSVAAFAVAMALPALSGAALAADQRNHDRHQRHHHRPRRRARHSGAQRAGIRAEGNRRPPDQADRARRRRRPDRGDHQCAAFRHGVEGRRDHGLVGDAADGGDLQRRQRGAGAAHRAGAAADHAGARQVVGGDAAADPDHGQGALRAHEEATTSRPSATSAIPTATAICGSTT